MALMRKDSRGRQAQEEKQGDACGLATNFKHDKESRMGRHNAASSGEHRKMGRTTCTYFSRPAQWTSSDAVGWGGFAMPSHNGRMVHNCNAKRVRCTPCQKK